MVVHGLQMMVHGGECWWFMVADDGLRMVNEGCQMVNDGNS